MAVPFASDASSARRVVEDLLATADVRIDGDRPWDVQVHDDRLYRRVLAEGTLGAGEAYMDGWWDCRALDAFFYRMLRHRVDDAVGTSWRHLWNVAKSWLLNLQDRTRAGAVADRHYDRGVDLFERMLDSRMIYSCGYWRTASTLEAAQEAKLDLVCRKLDLEPGMRVLDIGCGWGGFARYAARTYGVEVVGITISEDQAAWAREHVDHDAVEIRRQDYRDVHETFDRVVSIGMFEHVGYKNHGTYMDVVRRCLPEDGLSLLHTIGSHVDDTVTDPWIDKYIFPNGQVPSMRQIVEAAEPRFVIEDWHAFGPDYDRTLKAWHRNIEERWGEIGDRYDERFRRMWRYYLLQSAGSFRARRNQVWQIVLAPRGVEGGYRSRRAAGADEATESG
jgi:cyclopropane-fatty-acyl-phospholipid synthase